MSDSMKIISGGLVVTGDASRRIGPLTILVRNGRIQEVAPRVDALRLMYPQAEVIDAAGKLIFPGFVDAHVHGESILLRHATRSMPMNRWAREDSVQKAFSRFYGSSAAEGIRRTYEIACFAALKAGITAAAEFGFNRRDLPLSAAIDAYRRADMRGVLGVHNSEQLEVARRTRHPMLRFAMVLPEEDDLTVYSLQTTLRQAKEQGWPVILSYGESRRTYEALKKNFSRSVVQLAAEYRLFDHALQFHHLAHHEPGDLELLATQGVPVIVSPQSLLAKGTDAPPLSEMMRLKIPLAFGTDWGLPDPFGNAQALIRIAASQGITSIPVHQLVQMMTANPARALGMADAVGSVEPGKHADLTFVSMDGLRIGLLANERDAQDVVREVLTHGSSDRVTDVMVNGEFLVRSGQLLTYSEEELVGEAERLLRSLIDLRSDAALSVVSFEEPATEEGRTSPVIDMPGDEGFRVVRTGEADDPGATRVIPLQPKRGGGPALPKNVRRVFGDEDVS